MNSKNLLWIETFSGKKINPLSPSSEDIDIDDIAHSLAMQCRFNGHCEKFYSVAEHSLNTALYLMKKCGSSGSRVSLFALLHDATEAYLCDIPRPLKQFMPYYLNWEKELAAVIFAKFASHQPSSDEWNLVMEADNALLAIEARLLAKSGGKDWGLPKCKSQGIDIKCYQWSEAEEHFIELFNLLRSKVEKI